LIGLVLAGGDGSRLAADGVTEPKTSVELAGRPLLVALAETLLSVGCDSVTGMVPAARLSPLTALFATDRVRLHGCRTPSSLHTLAQGLSMVPAGPVFCTMVDTVMPRSDWKKLFGSVRAELANGADLVLAVTPFVDDERPLYVACDPQKNVRDIGDQPMEPVQVTGGVYGFSARARVAAGQAVEAGIQRMRGFLQRAVQAGLRTRAVEVPRIIDLDHASDLAAANAWLAAAEAR
jgi:CTP:molybdopterin cytidylyltransferase MocA